MWGSWPAMTPATAAATSSSDLLGDQDHPVALDVPLVQADLLGLRQRPIQHGHPDALAAVAAGLETVVTWFRQEFDRMVGARLLVEGGVGEHHDLAPGRPRRPRTRWSRRDWRGPVRCPRPRWGRGLSEGHRDGGGEVARAVADHRVVDRVRVLQVLVERQGELGGGDGGDALDGAHLGRAVLPTTTSVSVGNSAAALTAVALASLFSTSFVAPIGYCSAALAGSVNRWAAELELPTAPLPMIRMSPESPGGGRKEITAGCDSDVVERHRMLPHRMRARSPWRGAAGAHRAVRAPPRRRRRIPGSPADRRPIARSSVTGRQA